MSKKSLLVKSLIIILLGLSNYYKVLATNIPNLKFCDLQGNEYISSYIYCPGQTVIIISDNNSMNASITCQYEYIFKDNLGNVVSTMLWNNATNSNSFTIPTFWNGSYCVKMSLLPLQPSPSCTGGLDSSTNFCFIVGQKPPYANLNLSNHSFCSNDPLAALNFQSFVNYGDTCLYTIDGVGPYYLGWNGQTQFSKALSTLQLNAGLHYINLIQGGHCGRSYRLDSFLVTNNCCNTNDSSIIQVYPQHLSSNGQLYINSSDLVALFPAYFNQSGTILTLPTNKKLAFSCSLIIDQTYFKVQNSSILLGNNILIRLQAGKTLELSNSHLSSACDSMWNGIIVSNSTSKIKVNNNSLIEDALNAIQLNNYGDFEIRNSTFNKNNVSILFNCNPISANNSTFYNGITHGILSGCTFKCSANLKAPFSSISSPISYRFTRSASHIKLINARALNVTLGNPINGGQNRFYVYNDGITSINSQLNLINAKMSGVPTPANISGFPPLYIPPVSIPTGINAYVSGAVQKIMVNKLNVGGQSPYQKCIFDSLVIAVKENSILNSNIDHCLFRYNTNAISFTKCSNASINVTFNKLLNNENGIVYSFGGGSTLNITDDSIIVAMTNYLQHACYGVNIDNTNGVKSATISRNKVYYGTAGIYIYNSKNGINITDNIIQVYPWAYINALSPGASPKNISGIMLNGTGTGGNIGCNNISLGSKILTRNNASAISKNKVNGVSIINSIGWNISCNTFDSIVNGVYFSGACKTTDGLYGNMFDKDIFYAIYASKNTTFGTHKYVRNTQIDNGNIYNGSKPGWIVNANGVSGAATYYESTNIVGTSIGTIYDNINYPYLICSPQDCGFHINCNQINISHSTGLNYFKCIDSCKKVINTGLTNFNLENPYYNQADDSLLILSSQAISELNATDEVYNFQNAAYVTNMIIQDSTLLNIDSIAQINNQYLDNIGHHYAEILNKIEDSVSYEEIEELISQVPTGSQLEGNTVKYLHLINFITHDSLGSISAGMYDTISLLANACQSTTGVSVSGAKSLAFLVDNYFMPDNLDCEFANRGIESFESFDTISQFNNSTSIIPTNIILNASPNPSADLVTLSLINPSMLESVNSTEVSIYNILGEVFLNSLKVSSDKTQVSVANWPNGIYICKNKYGLYLGKFVVEHN